MSTFALIHGAGDGGWYWHLVAAELRSRGYDVVAPTSPPTTNPPPSPITPTRWSTPSAVGKTCSLPASRTEPSPHHWNGLGGAGRYAR